MNMTNPTMQRLLNQGMLNLAVSLIWAMFKLVRRFEPRFRQSLRGFDAVLEFRNEGASLQLIFAGGDITLSRKRRTPDFSIDFVDLPGAIEAMKNDPGNVLRLLLENKITKSGNNYYLMKFGYLTSLSERFFDERATLVKSRWELIRG